MKLNNHSLRTYYSWRILTRIVILMIPSVISMLSGCATSALMKEAKGQVKSQARIVVNSITDAYKDGDVVHVCMNAYDLDEQSNYEMTLNIPLQKRDRFNVSLPQYDGDIKSARGQLSSVAPSPYVGFSPKPEDLMRVCFKKGNRLPIFNLSAVVSPYDSYSNHEQMSFILPSGVKEAIYVIGNKYTPTNFGYVSTRQIADNSYSVDIQTKQMADMKSMKNTKHYLYVLTPLTVAADTTVIAVQVVVHTLLDPRTYIHRDGSVIIHQ